MHKLLMALAVAMIAVCTTLSAGDNVVACQWQGCAAAAVSWSLDDSGSDCMRQLDALGLTGTFYLWHDYLEGRFEDQDFRRFHLQSERGSEIGTHTVDHPCHGAPVLNSTEDYLARELAPSISDIECEYREPVLTLAWPCGCHSPETIAAAKEAGLLGARGYPEPESQGCGTADGGINNPKDLLKGSDAVFTLKALHTYSGEAVDEAIVKGGWVIVVSHGDHEAVGSSRCLGLDEIAALSSNHAHCSSVRKDQKCAWVAPVGDVLRYVFEQHSFEGQQATYAVDQTRNVITVTASHGMTPVNRTQECVRHDALEREHRWARYTLSHDDIHFDVPLTLAIKVPRGRMVREVRVNNAPTIESMSMVPVPFRYLPETGVVQVDVDLSYRRTIVVELK